jgi:hypothetical protein
MKNFSVSAKFPDIPYLRLVLECDGSVIEDDDVPDASVADGLVLLVLSSSQQWSRESAV